MLLGLQPAAEPVQLRRGDEGQGFLGARVTYLCKYLAESVAEFGGDEAGPAQARHPERFDGDARWLANERDYTRAIVLSLRQRQAWAGQYNAAKQATGRDRPPGHAHLWTSVRQSHERPPIWRRRSGRSPSMKVEEVEFEGTGLPVMLTTRQVAQALHVDPSTLCRWRADGIGPRVHWLGESSPRYCARDVLAWLDGRAA